ncbi:MAG: acetyl-CoA carboxylase, biotin carboxyl carrier protein, partial [Sphingobacteriales bacterium]
MDFKQIQELIQLVNDSNIGEVTIEQKEFKITIRQKEEQITQVMAASMPQMQLPMQQMPQQQAALPQQAGAGSAAPAAAPAASNTITIKSPMIGTFYRRPSP